MSFRTGLEEEEGGGEGDERSALVSSSANTFERPSRDRKTEESTTYQKASTLMLVESVLIEQERRKLLPLEAKETLVDREGRRLPSVTVE